jgi:hypothetical protein
MKAAVIVTSIAGPTDILRLIADGCAAAGWRFILIGDWKSPENFELAGCDYYPIERQQRLGFSINEKLPYNSYARKILGYLIAMQAGYHVIVEIDDDNLPMEGFWRDTGMETEATTVNTPGWVNIYRYFGDGCACPRGFPLEYSMQTPPLEGHRQVACCPIQQGLVDGDPDVNAVYRMTNNTSIFFTQREPVALGPGSWCTFNSQNTRWFDVAFPLMYLPSYCTFRMTDIWRGLVAQRILWTCGYRVLFSSPTARQERNAHNLLQDFRHEVPGYLHNEQIRARLVALDLAAGVEHMADNLRVCYEALVYEGWIESKDELDLVDRWRRDVEKVTAG